MRAPIDVRSLEKVEKNTVLTHLRINPNIFLFFLFDYKQEKLEKPKKNSDKFVRFFFSIKISVCYYKIRHRKIFKY